MKIAELLQETYDLLSDPDHWTQGTMCRDADGLAIETVRVKADGNLEGVPPSDGVLSPRAVKWCAVGGLDKVSLERMGIFSPQDVHSFLKTVIADMELHDPHSLSLDQVNDFFDHATTMQVFEKAIAKAQEMGV